MTSTAVDPGIEGTATGPALPGRLLGVWAHPDDEAYLAAGLMAAVVAAGGSVTTVAVTDGEAGFGADDERSAGERGRQRRGELRSAMSTIGVTDIRHLGIPDGSVAAATDGPLVGQIVSVIRQVRPDAVVTFGPDGVTGHDDHIATWRLVTRAWLECGHGRLWYAAKTDGWLEEWRSMHDDLGVWMTEEPPGVDETEVDLGLDLDGAGLARKRSVLAQHASQTSGLAGAMGEDRYCAWIRRETFRRPTVADLRRL